MAIRYAVASGNVNALTTWDGGTLPAIGDYIYANGFNVTINVDINFGDGSLTTEICPITGIGGGSFIQTTNRTLITNIIGGQSVCLASSGVITSNIVGNIIGINADAISLYINNFGTSQINLIGDLIPSVSAHCINVSGNGAGRFFNMTMVGNCNSSSGKLGLYNTNIIINSIKVTGNYMSGGALCFSSPSTSFEGVGSFRASASASVVVGTATCIAKLSGILENVNSRMAVVFNNMYIDSTTPLVWKFYDNNNEEKSLYTDDAFDYAIESDTRDGVTYANGTRTGTLKVAPPSLVVKDVPTDNTVGSWAFTSDIITRLENIVTENYLNTQLGNLTI